MRRKCEKNRKNRGSKMGKIQRNTPFEAFKNVIFLVRFSPEFSQIRSNLTPPILTPQNAVYKSKNREILGHFWGLQKSRNFWLKWCVPLDFDDFFEKSEKKSGRKKTWYYIDILWHTEKIAIFVFFENTQMGTQTVIWIFRQKTRYPSPP